MSILIERVDFDRPCHIYKSVAPDFDPGTLAVERYLKNLIESHRFTMLQIPSPRLPKFNFGDLAPILIDLVDFDRPCHIYKSVPPVFDPATLSDASNPLTEIIEI